MRLFTQTQEIRTPGGAPGNLHFMSSPDRSKRKKNAVNDENVCVKHVSFHVEPVMKEHSEWKAFILSVEQITSPLGAEVAFL